MYSNVIVLKTVYFFQTNIVAVIQKPRYCVHTFVACPLTDMDVRFADAGII